MPADSGDIDRLKADISALAGDGISMREHAGNVMEFFTYRELKWLLGKKVVEHSATITLDPASASVLYRERLTERTIGVAPPFNFGTWSQSGTEVTSESVSSAPGGGETKAEFGKLRPLVESVAHKHGWRFGASLR